MYKVSARPTYSTIGLPGGEPGAAARNLIWRFYADRNQQWRWQRLSVQGDVISQSARSYRDFDDCISDAEASGYMFRPAQPRKSTCYAEAAR